MRADGGEASALTKGKRGVKNFAWSPDGKQIAYLAPTQKQKRRKRRKKTKMTRVSWIRKINTLASGCSLSHRRSQSPHRTKWDIRETVWHPSGTGLMLSATDHPSRIRTPNAFFPFVSRTLGIPTKVVDSWHKSLLRADPSAIFASQRMARGWRSRLPRDGPTPHDLMLARHGEKGVQNLPARAWTGRILDFRCLKMACWSRLWKMVSARSSSLSRLKA